MGKTSKPDMRRYFAIARGSAMECGAILDVFATLEIIERKEAETAKLLVERIVAMLTRHIRPLP